MNSPVSRFSPTDVELRGRDGNTNPFLVRVDAVVTGPRGQSMGVPGFYDGAGQQRGGRALSGQTG